MMEIYISQGQYTSTGREVSGWTVNITATAPGKFDKLADAKAWAVLQGASGKWKREIRHNGVRGKPRIYYLDATCEAACNGGDG